MEKAFRAKAICSIWPSNHNIVEKSGSWYSYKGERIGQGRENARQFLKDNKDVMAKLDTEVRKALGLIAESGAAGRRCGSGQRPRQARGYDHAERPAEPVKAPIVAAQGVNFVAASRARRVFAAPGLLLILLTAVPISTIAIVRPPA